jgi:hypothetical protein
MLHELSIYAPSYRETPCICTLLRVLCVHSPIQDPGWTACGPARRLPRCLTPLDSVMPACPHRPNANSDLIEATAGGGAGEETCENHAGQGITFRSNSAQSYFQGEQNWICTGRERAFMLSVALNTQFPLVIRKRGDDFLPVYDSLPQLHVCSQSLSSES